MRRYLIAGNLALVMALSPSIAAGSSAEAAYRLETEAFTLEWREMPLTVPRSTPTWDG